LSEDGVEMTFATNYLGHFLLTRLLLEKMAETARATGVEGRIVNVSSTIHSWFAGDDALSYLDRVTRRKMYVARYSYPPP
jgi:NAD(P)-dependent dehydrogenase (short-subunit alcohol dehydrogenase family)